MKKLVVAAAASLVMGVASLANAAGTIQFDPDGAGGAAAVAVDFFDWLPGNSIAIAALSTPPVGGVRTFEVVSQGRLGVLVGPGGVALPAGQITFQARFFEDATGLGTSSATFGLGAGASAFTVYYNSAIVANEFAGTGYDAGVAILSGTLTSLTGNFTNNSILAGGTCGTAGTGTSCGLLDLQGADNQSGVRSHSGNGSTTIEVDVTYADPTFFLSNVTSLMVDLQDTTNNAAPFAMANPSDMVFGVTPVYSLASDGTKVNGAACTFGGQTETGAGGTQAQCDIHLQTDGSTSFNPVPEPGSLAIVGLALGLLGLSRRQKKA